MPRVLDTPCPAQLFPSLRWLTPWEKKRDGGMEVSNRKKRVLCRWGLKEERELETEGGCNASEPHYGLTRRLDCALQRRCTCRISGASGRLVRYSTERISGQIMRFSFFHCDPFPSRRLSFRAMTSHTREILTWLIYIGGMGVYCNKWLYIGRVLFLNLFLTIMSIANYVIYGNSISVFVVWEIYHPMDQYCGEFNLW